MSDRFAVGEVAWLVAWLVAWSGATDPVRTNASGYFGTEVTVDSAPMVSWQYVGDVGYWVITQDGKRIDVGVVCLKKRRPPQDWVRICRLSERPVEEPA